MDLRSIQSRAIYSRAQRGETSQHSEFGSRLDHAKADYAGHAPTTGQVRFRHQAVSRRYQAEYGNQPCHSTRIPLIEYTESQLRV